MFYGMSFLGGSTVVINDGGDLVEQSRCHATITQLMRSNNVEWEKDFIKIDDFLIFASFSSTLVRLSIRIAIVVLALTLTKSPCPVLLSPAETSLMLWL